ncbi:MAG: hypothetical protein JWP63_5091 [Candidatus Solibacter sp.]|nr:hypothetical protein [Candidatus Solibacter sp.]
MRCLVFFLLPFALAAQAPPAPDTLCSLSGTVINAVTSEPVRRALIAIRRVDGSPGTTMTIRVTNAVSTDAAGRFALNGIEPGTYRLSADHNGFIPAQYGARGPNRAGTPIVLAGGQKSANLIVGMYPHGVISGRVLDEEGEPVAAAEIQVSRLQYMQGRKQLVRSGGATTNDLGEYRVFGLAPGRYFVNATYRPDPVAIDAANSAGEGVYVPTYFPRTADPAAAAPLDLTAGAQLRNMEITLARVRTVTVKGRVQSEITTATPLPGEPLIRANLNVILSTNNPLGAGGGNGRGAPVGPDGSFEFRNVVPGTYLAVAIASTPGKAYSARLPLVVGTANIEGLSLAIHAPVAIAGQVKIDGESADSLSKFRIGLQPWEASNAVFGPMPDVPLRPDGSFQIPDLSAEHYRLNFYGLPDGFYVKSIRSSSVDVQLAGLDLSAGAPAPIAIVLSPNAGQVTGTVLDPKTQKPVSAVTVIAVPQEKERRERESFYKTAATDQSGHFTFKNLTPGDYKVFCWEDVPFGSWMDPEFLSAHDSKGEPVAVREGSPQSIQVTLIADQ